MRLIGDPQGIVQETPVMELRAVCSHLFIAITPRSTFVPGC